MNVQFTNVSNFRITGLNTTGVSIKSGMGGVILSYNFINQNQYPVYAKFFDAKNPILAGTDSPLLVVGINAAGATATSNYGISTNYSSYFPIKSFGSGLYVLATSGANDSSSSNSPLGIYLYGEITYI